MEHCSRQVRENQAVNTIISQIQGDLNYSAPSGSIKQEVFWQKILRHFKSRRDDFSLFNIEFCVEKLFGHAKYPINVWN